MNIGELIKKLTKKEIKVNSQLLNVPKIIFESDILQVIVGTWLGVLPDAYVKKYQKFIMLTPKNVIDLGLLDDNYKQKINNAFGLFLKLIGVDENEICTLYYDETSKFTFECNFVKSNGKALISLKHGHGFDYYSEFIISYNNIESHFDYKGDINPDNIVLTCYYITNPNNGNVYYRLFSSSKCYYSVYNERFRFSIEVSSPIHVVDNSNYKFALPDEDKVQQFLSDLSFNEDVNEIFNKICENCNLSLETLKIYPRISLKLEESLISTKEIVLNEIVICNGKLESFSLSKGGVTISGTDLHNFKCVVNDYQKGLNLDGIVEDILNSEFLIKFFSENSKKLKMQK